MQITSEKAIRGRAVLLKLGIIRWYAVRPSWHSDSAGLELEKPLIYTAKGCVPSGSGLLLPPVPTLREAAPLIGVHPRTLQTWSTIGKLNAITGLVGQRLIDAEGCQFIVVTSSMAARP